MTILGALMGFLLLSGAMSAMPAHADAPTLPTYAVTLTAYNAVSAQTDSSPFETASGAFSNPEVVAARSQDLGDELPFGTIIAIDGANASKNGCGYNVVAPVIGYRVIEDTMNARLHNRIDVLLSTKAEYRTADQGMQNAAEVMGLCTGVTVKVVGHVSFNHIPKTQAALKALVEGTNTDLALK